MEQKIFLIDSYACQFSGKILTDEQPLTEYNIDEKKFIVVMVSKPKPSETSSTEEVKAESNSNKEQATSAPSSTTTTTTTRYLINFPIENQLKHLIHFLTICSSQQPASAPAPATQTTPSRPRQPESTRPAATATTVRTDQPESALLMGDEYMTMVNNIMDMGYIL